MDSQIEEFYRDFFVVDLFTLGFCPKIPVINFSCLIKRQILDIQAWIASPGDAITCFASGISFVINVSALMF
jgi:hypothetical protein